MPLIGRHAFSLLCALLAAGALWRWWAGAADAPHASPWLWQAAHWRDAPWTLWSAALVHGSGAHLLANALALAALAVLGAALSATRGDALALLLAWPLSTIALLGWPAVQAYYGLSGVVHAAAAVLALRGMAQAGTRSIGVLMAGGLLAKLLLERGWATPIGFDGRWGFNVAYAAHLTGAAAGALVALALQAAPRLRPHAAHGS